ncbi:MAG: hypothetical protein ABJG41_11495 [Cyclobacteriaceae bacterium]
MEKKNKRLFGLIVLVLIINLVIFLLPGKGSKTTFDEHMFTVADTASVSSVQLTFGDKVVEMNRSDEGWELNGQHRMDEGLRRLLFSIMQRVRVKRPVHEAVKDGVKVKLNNDSFMVSGNATQTKTYFTKNGKSYEVEIPGYRDYLASIFELNADQWRDRLIFNGSWRTIQRLNLDYTESDEKDFEIGFNEEFFNVSGVNKLDSGFVVDYLNQFQYLQANERISRGRFPRYDSLVQTRPLATLTLESINYSAPETLIIYPSLEKEGFNLVKNSIGEMVILDRRRISNMLMSRDDFKLAE